MNSFLQASLAALALYTPFTSALAVFSPSGGPTYTVGIAPSTGSGSSDVYFQLSAPTSSYQWVGLGIGQSMAGASIFVMYADGNGNVTLSPRNGGPGHVEPTVDSSLQVELLEGSGIVNGSMVANVKCTSCASIIGSLSSTSSSWIAAWNTGAAINSASLSYSIDQHAANHYRQFTFDLTQASITSDTNPFVGAATTSATASSGGAAPTGSGSGGTTSSSSSDDDVELIPKYDKVHGILMGVTVVILFPVGAILMRTVGGVWVHGAWQIVSLWALIAGFGSGIKLSKLTGDKFNTAHTRFGTVIVALFLIQPIIGLLHHLAYRKQQRRGPLGHLHIWYGRIVMLLGIVNGGLGLKLAANSHNGKIAYAVVAAVIGALYILVAAGAVFKEKRSKRGTEKQVNSVDHVSNAS